MSSEDQADATAASDETARTVGQLVKYSRELNQSDTVGEVGSYALEATFHVMDGHPSPTVFEVQHGEVRVIESMAARYAPADGPGPIVGRAIAADRTVIVTDEAAVGYGPEQVDIAAVDAFDGTVRADVSLAAPSLYADDSGDVGVVLLVQWDSLDSVQEYHVKPIEYLADHVATAIANIRSRERLERARNDLATRKELIEMYDRLLRHDLGNDLQVIAGYSDVLVELVDAEDGQVADYAEKIQRTASNASDLIERVGDLVGTLEEENEPEVRELEPVLTETVEAVDAKFESLAIEYDPTDFETQVYAGDLLDSVFANVLSNAAVHNDGAVTVEVYADEPNPETFVVGFADDGAGVADEVREEIFEMGRKGPDSEGTGFGLGFVRALTESYGGGVTIGDGDGGGADFRVALERA